MRTRSTMFLALFLSGTMAASVAVAADGDLDGFFSGDGATTTVIAPGSGYDAVEDAAVQWNGKIVVAGVANMGGSTGEDFAVTRYNPDGTLDATFGGGDGSTTTDFGGGSDGAHGLAIQWDGKIVVAGLADMATSGTGYDFAVARYNIDGTLDTTFSGDGKVTTAASSGAGLDSLYDVALQSDGKIVVVGYTTTPALGYDFAVARYNIDGNLDTTFSGDGVETTPVAPGSRTDSALDVTIQPDGRLVVVGYSYMDDTTYNDIAIVRYTTDGTPDETFSGDGRTTIDIDNAYTDKGVSVALQSDGKVVVGVEHDPGAITNSDLALVRLTSGGTLDTTFGGGDGVVLTDIAGSADYVLSIARQLDGRVVVVGSSYLGGPLGYEMVVARYNIDGTLDTSFSADGAATTSIGAGANEDWLKSVALSWDGKIIGGGYSMVGPSTGIDAAVVRFNAASKIARRTSLTAATLLRRSPPKGATVKITVAKTSRKVCAVSGSKLKTIKAGVCKATISMTPKKTKTLKKPKTTTVTVSFTVVN